MVRASLDDVVEQAAVQALKLRRSIEDAEEMLQVEVTHSLKFMWRGKGLRHDFAHSRSARRRALLRGVRDNERALLTAMDEAIAAGLPREYLEDAVRAANSLAVARAEIEQDYVRLEGARMDDG